MGGRASRMQTCKEAVERRLRPCRKETLGVVVVVKMRRCYRLARRLFGVFKLRPNESEWNPVERIMTQCWISVNRDSDSHKGLLLTRRT